MKARLISKKLEAKDTWSLFFEPETLLNYSPGQFAYITLDNILDDRGDTRQFSLVSSPTTDKFLQFSAREGLTDYKKKLISLRESEIVEINYPHGLYLWPNKKHHNIFIAGGIGIAPFISRLRYSFDNKIKAQTKLIYSNRSVESAPFLDEVTKWADKSLISFEFVDTSKTKRIDANKLKQEIFDEADYWICGTPNMVNDIEDMLLGLGVKLENIKSEKFTGY